MNYVGNQPVPAGVILVGDTNPIGMVMWSHKAPDASYLQMNGQIVSKTFYPDLWTYAQGFLTADQTLNPGLYRSVDANTFAVPNLSGLFIRGTGQVDGSHVAAALGVKQGDDNISHSHQQAGAPFTGSGPNWPSTGTPTGPSAQATTTANSGGTEARPVNVALMPCVKALKTLLIPTGTISPAYTFASAAEVLAATEAAKAVSPLTLKSNPGVAKVWARFVSINLLNPTIQVSHNVSSITRISAGVYQINFTVPFLSSNFCAMVSGTHTGGTGNVLACPHTTGTGFCQVLVTGASFSTPVDTNQTINFAAWGEQ